MKRRRRRKARTNANEAKGRTKNTVLIREGEGVEGKRRIYRQLLPYLPSSPAGPSFDQREEWEATEMNLQ